MSDDTELYIESGGDLTTLVRENDCREMHLYNKSKKKKSKRTITENKTSGFSVEKEAKKKRKNDKIKNTILLIDGENISSKKAEQIIKIAEQQGKICLSKVYGIQKDQHTEGWSDKAKEYGLKDIRLCGGPQKDKVDKKIQRDAIKEIKNNKNVDTVCIATSDKGYIETIRELRQHGKRVVVIGEQKATKDLRNSCNKFSEI